MTFSAEATLPTPEPTTLSIISGDNQEEFTGEALTNPFVTEVRDQHGAPMEGVTVTFTVLTGSGTLSAETVMTDANGRAESTLTLGTEPRHGHRRGNCRRYLPNGGLERRSDPPTTDSNQLINYLR